MIILAYVCVNRAVRAIGIIIVANGDDKIWIPAFDKICHIRFILTGEAKIPDHGKDHISRLQKVFVDLVWMPSRRHYLFRLAW